MLSNVPVYLLYCIFLAFGCHAVRPGQGSWFTISDNEVFYTTIQYNCSKVYSDVLFNLFVYVYRLIGSLTTPTACIKDQKFLLKVNLSFGFTAISFSE